MNYCYLIYGLKVSLPFRCDSLTFSLTSDTPDIIIEEGTIPHCLDIVQSAGNCWQASTEQVLMHAPSEVGSFLVESGNHVTLQRAKGATDDLLVSQFIASAMAIILQQRGQLVFHANCVTTPTGAVAIAGESGSGKSTLLAALLARGCKMLSDDVTAIYPRDDGRFMVTPGMPHLHICPQTAENFRLDIKDLPQYSWRRMKVAFPVSAQMATTELPLQAIYFLSPHDGDSVLLHPLHGAEKFNQLQRYLYGPLLTSQHLAIFPLLSNLIKQVKLYRLQRPARRWAVAETRDIILQGDHNGNY